ncbi:hypothetical protein ACN6LM_000438 [Streptomyces sp. SAS_281]|uniref:hypothetical protein n=1 Tax=Streptomyces sp. SAS_281 TaxID=3412744 RepID=UPI00403C2791
MNRRRGTDSPGEPLGPDNGLDAGMDRKKKDKPEPPKQYVANPSKSTGVFKRSSDPKTDSFTRLIAETVGKKPKKPRVSAAKGKKNPDVRKPQVDAKSAALRLAREAGHARRDIAKRNAYNAELDAALQDYERPIPEEVADILAEIIRVRPPASGMPPRRRQ